MARDVVERHWTQVLRELTQMYRGQLLPVAADDVAALLSVVEAAKDVYEHGGGKWEKLGPLLARLYAGSSGESD